MKISLCMIVKDEEATLEKCLLSAKPIADEIIIVDTGSSDSTKEIALSFTDKVYDFAWIDDFSAARNFAFSKATKEFIMWLDADDVLPQESVSKLKVLKKSLSNDVDVIYMPYNVAFDESGTPTFSYYRERIVRRACSPRWIEPVHEVIEIRGKALYTDIAVEHRKQKLNPSGRNLNIMRKQLALGKKLSPRLSFYYARELMFNGETSAAVEEFENFLDNKNGWSENKICACDDLSVCYEILGNDEEALRFALLGLSYDLPRRKTLCRIGELFLKQQRLKEAEYWYKAALSCPQSDNLGFNQADYNVFIPALQLCVIYDKLGKFDEAEKYNEIAGKEKPHSPAYIYNRKYFNTKK